MLPLGLSQTFRPAGALVTERLLDANEVAERLHVPVSWVRESTRSSAMPHVSLGRYEAIKRAGITKPFRPWHGLRHTALTETAAASVPAMFVQAKAARAQGSTTERYLHTASISYPDAAELAEARLFNTLEES